jgi:hypothetical protein
MSGERSSKRTRTYPTLEVDIGPNYQCEIPRFIEGQSQFASNFEGSPLWLGQRICIAETQEYLEMVKELFSNSRLQYSEERALYFLHRCNYDVKQATQILRPWQEEHDPAQITAELESEDHCFICGDGGSLMLCDAPGCPKVYHAPCILMDKVCDCGNALLTIILI